MVGGPGGESEERRKSGVNRMCVKTKNSTKHTYCSVSFTTSTSHCHGPKAPSQAHSEFHIVVIAFAINGGPFWWHLWAVFSLPWCAVTGGVES